MRPYSPAVALLLVGAAAAMALTGCGAIVANPVGPAPGDTAAQEHFWVAEPQEVRIAALRKDLLSLGAGVAPAEADRLAGAAVRYAEVLAHEYHMSRPVELHNVLVAAGLKPRGRCYELADDLYVRLRALRPRSVDLYRGVADKDDLIHEHNCVVVAAKGQPFGSGLVLDAWRYAGKLRWLRVADDHHPWRMKRIKGQAQPDDPVLAGAGGAGGTGGAAPRERSGTGWGS